MEISRQDLSKPTVFVGNVVEIFSNPQRRVYGISRRDRSKATATGLWKYLVEIVLKPPFFWLRAPLYIFLLWRKSAQKFVPGGVNVLSYSKCCLACHTAIKNSLPIKETNEKQLISSPFLNALACLPARHRSMLWPGLRFLRLTIASTVVSTIASTIASINHRS